ncbi:MAG: hypothetical protein HRT87_03050 [Legionellales bacterium]|nr:hypothetical protein [Legionellales bacterium]
MIKKNILFFLFCFYSVSCFAVDIYLEVEESSYNIDKNKLREYLDNNIFNHPHAKRILDDISSQKKITISFDFSAMRMGTVGMCDATEKKIIILSNEMMAGVIKGNKYNNVKDFNASEEISNFCSIIYHEMNNIFNQKIEEIQKALREKPHKFLQKFPKAENFAKKHEKAEYPSFVAQKKFTVNNATKWNLSMENLKTVQRHSNMGFNEYSKMLDSLDFGAGISHMSMYRLQHNFRNIGELISEIQQSKNLHTKKVMSILEKIPANFFKMRYSLKYVIELRENLGLLYTEIKPGYSTKEYLGRIIEELDVVIDSSKKLPDFNVRRILNKIDELLKFIDNNN